MPSKPKTQQYLYEENAYQNLGFDKHSRVMIKFRKSLENKWCETFRAYMRTSTPQWLVLWKELNPNVGRILDAYDGYIRHLRINGIAK